MLDETSAGKFKDFIESAQSVLVLFPSTASTEQKAIAASLFLALNRANKATRLVTPVLPETQEVTIVGLESAQTDLGNQNLTIGFSYTPEQVDKVSYHIGEESHKFFLTIKPKPGFTPLDASTVEFSYTGASADLVITIGVSNLENLEQLYFGYEELYKTAAVVSIAPAESSFATVSIDTSTSSTAAEVVAELIPVLGLPLDSDTATNLLLGIESTTANLTSMTMSADTFEAVAQLLRAGARRSARKTTTSLNGFAEHMSASRARQPHGVLIEEGSILHQVHTKDGVAESRAENRSSTTKNGGNEGILEKTSADSRSTSFKNGSAVSNDSALVESTPVKKTATRSKKSSAEPPAGFTPSRMI